MKKSFQWLEKASLEDSTEALVMATQVRALRTRSTETGVFHIRKDPMSSLCQDAPETVQHMAAEHKLLAGTTFTERQNQVAEMVCMAVRGP